MTCEDKASKKIEKDRSRLKWNGEIPNSENLVKANTPPLVNSNIWFCLSWCIGNNCFSLFIVFLGLGVGFSTPLVFRFLDRVLSLTIPLDSLRRSSPLFFFLFLVNEINLLIQKKIKTFGNINRKNEFALLKIQSLDQLKTIFLLLPWRGETPGSLNLNLFLICRNPSHWQDDANRYEVFSCHQLSQNRIMSNTYARHNIYGTCY